MGTKELTPLEQRMQYLRAHIAIKDFQRPMMHIMYAGRYASWDGLIARWQAWREYIAENETIIKPPRKTHG